MQQTKRQIIIKPKPKRTSILKKQIDDKGRIKGKIYLEYITLQGSTTLLRFHLTMAA